MNKKHYQIFNLFLRNLLDVSGSPEIIWLLKKIFSQILHTVKKGDIIIRLKNILKMLIQLTVKQPSFIYQKLLYMITFCVYIVESAPGDWSISPWFESGMLYECTGTATILGHRNFIVSDFKIFLKYTSGISIILAVSRIYNSF